MSVPESSGSPGADAPSPQRRPSLNDEPSLAAAADPDLAVAYLDLEVRPGERVDRLVRQARPAVHAERLHRPALHEQLAVAEPQLPAGAVGPRAGRA